MSLALPTLLLVAALIPSIAFINSFYAGTFPKQLAGLSPLTELALYFFWAIPIDAAALRIARISIDHHACEIGARVFGLSTGKVDLGPLFQLLEHGKFWPWVWNYIFLVLGAAVFGAASRKLVWVSRLDARIAGLRIKADWYYVLLGRYLGSPYTILSQADVLASHPKGDRLYVGLVSRLELARDGSVEALYLTNAQRYRVNAAGQSSLVDIPGEVLALRWPNIHSINMRYYVAQGPSGKLSRFRWHAANLLRTLFTEE